MAEKSGRTEKTTDWMGNEKEVHYDSDGHKVGETRFTTDWMGNPKQEHLDTSGNKIGETKAGTDFWGQSRAEHYDNDGKMIAYSRDDADWTGSYVQKHYNTSHEQVGSTRRETGILGDTKKVHEGEYFKARGRESSPEQTISTSSGGDSGSGSYSDYGSSTTRTTIKPGYKEGRGLTFGVVFGRITSLVTIAGLAVLMGFWENYRLNGPHENYGQLLIYVTFGSAILVALLERGFWFSFLAGCMVTLGSAYGLSLYPVNYPYMTPLGAIVSGFQFTLICGFVGWLAKKITHRCNRSGWLSVLTSWLILAIAVWQLLSLSSLIVGSESNSNVVLARSTDVQPTITPDIQKKTATPVVVSDETQLGKTYTVERGDTLWAIAERFYNDGTRWVEIAQANNLTNPSLIHTGNVLIIP